MNLYKIRNFLFMLRDNLYKRVWFLRPLYETKNTGWEITLSGFFKQKILSSNRFVPWPVHSNSIVFGIRWIKIGKNTAPGISFGNYIFAKEDSPIEFGDYCLLAPNVVVAGYSHSIYDIHSYTSKGGVRIGDYCWIGANCVILPGVVLGDHTVVAAGAVVTRPFPDGYCVLGGNPAKVIKYLDPNKVVKHVNENSYVGFKKVRR